MEQVRKWMVFEAVLACEGHPENPLWGVTPQVTFSGPDGSETTVDAFWDGGNTWRVRFSPGQTGKWTWRARQDPATQIAQGQFECLPYQGPNPLYRHGPLQLSPNRLYLMHSDGTPFFWLADTAWNGVLRSTLTDWQHYLHRRAEQAFTAVQFVSTEWRGCTKDPHGETAFEDAERIRLNPEFFRRMDAKVAAINDNGLVAAPVILWAVSRSDVGQRLSEDNAVRLARYIVARWGAYNVLWFLGGDGHYEGEKAQRWRNIGRRVFGERHDRPVTMHPCGLSWVAEGFRDEAWYDLVGYQSGHGDGERDLRWLTSGPPATAWREQPPRPIINLEPNYEGHPAYQSKQPHPPLHVRRAAYWSLLSAPTAAGVSYGTNPIWLWAEKVEDAEGHANLPNIGPWHTGLEAPGIQQMTLMRELFGTLPWHQLAAAPNLLEAQPGADDPQAHTACAATPDARCVVAYTPVGGVISLHTAELALPAAATWLDPRSGQSREAGRVQTPQQEFVAPSNEDWVLVLRAVAK